MMPSADQGYTFRQWLVSGLIAGALGALAFATLHALVIVPVWDSVFGLGAVIRGVASGTAAAWLAYELHRGIAPSPRTGAGVGLLLWMLVLPATVFGAVASLLDWRGPLGGWEMVIEVILTLAVAAAVARQYATRRSTTLATCGAALIFVLVLGGPFPIMVSTPAIGLLTGLLPIFVVVGAVMAAIVSRLPVSKLQNE